MTRFSIFDYGSSAWKAARTSTNSVEYADHLFSPERLSFRLEVFANFWLPAVTGAAAATPTPVKHVVYLSEQLPKNWKKKLRALPLPSFIDLVAVSSLREAKDHFGGLKRKALGEGLLVASYTLDDDDIVGANFFANLDAHATADNVGKVISLSRGIQAVYQSGKFWVARDLFAPFIAIGHAKVEKLPDESEIEGAERANQGSAWPRTNVQGGGHKASATRNPTIVDGRFLNWLNVRSETQDTGFGVEGRDWAKVIRRVKAESALDLEWASECGLGWLPLNTTDPPG